VELGNKNRTVAQDHLGWSLQALATDATGQRSLFPDFVCRPDELALDYSHWSDVARSLLASEFSSEQLETLRAIDLRLAAMSAGGPEFDAELWSDRGLESDARWEELRSLARAALTRLQWPVESPPPRRSVYVPGGPVDAGSG
jgi:hypothetical protein